MGLTIDTVLEDPLEKQEAVASREGERGAYKYAAKALRVIVGLIFVTSNHL